LVVNVVPATRPRGARSSFGFRRRSRSARRVAGRRHVTDRSSVPTNCTYVLRRARARRARRRRTSGFR